MDASTVYDKIYRYIYFKIHDRDIAEDITQETFLRFISRYGDSRGYNMKLMYTIAKNLCVDEYRRELTFPLDDERDTTHFSQDDVLNKIAISKALEKLSPEERELIFLRYANEESMITISSLYKCSRFSTHRKIKKAFEKLRNYLEVDIGDE